MRKVNFISFGTSLQRCLARHNEPYGPLKELVKFMKKNQIAQNGRDVCYWKVLIAEEEKNYKKVICLIEEGKFRKSEHKRLQIIWNKTLEKWQMEIKSACALTGIQRHRLFKKHPWPKSISDGIEDVKYGLRQDSRKVLKDFYATNPIPNLEEKYKLAKKTGYSVKQGETFKCY